MADLKRSAKKSMPGITPVPQDDQDAWATALGLIIWSMAQMEWQTYLWAERIGGHVLKDRLIEKRGFGSRQKLLLSSVMDQTWPEERKRKAKTLWRKALGFSNFRNVVAHNPVIENRRYPGVFGLVDARGSGPRSHRVYFPAFLYQVAPKMQLHALALHVFWDDETKPEPNQSLQPTALLGRG